MSSFLKRVDGIVRKHSILTSSLAGFGFGSIGDCAAQIHEEGFEQWRRKPHDYFRSFLVGGYYSCTSALFWHPFYGWMDRTFKTVAAKVFVDNFIALPFIDIPAFYFCTISPRLGLNESFKRLENDYQTSLISGWLLWVPITTVVFAYSPAHLRLPIFFAVDSVWAGALSFISNQSDHQPESHAGRDEISSNTEDANGVAAASHDESRMENTSGSPRLK